MEIKIIMCIFASMKQAIVYNLTDFAAKYQLNVSTAYLSRLVKEISGSTVNDHVSSLLYKEICNLLKQSDMTMGEIADSLHFSDQSALSNVFKLRSGMSPLAYRNQ